MRVSTFCALGGMALVASADVLTDTFTAYTTVTVISCAPTHTDCPEGSLTVVATITDTVPCTTATPAVVPHPASSGQATYSPIVPLPTNTPIESTSAPAESTPAPVIVPGSSESYSSTSTVIVSSVAPSSEVVSSVAASSVTTSSIASSAAPSSAAASSEKPSSKPIGSTVVPVVSNSTGILTASSKIETSTSTVLSTSAHSVTAPFSSTAPKQTGVSGASNVIVPGFTLGLLALGAVIFG